MRAWLTLFLTLFCSLSLRATASAALALGAGSGAILYWSYSPTAPARSLAEWLLGRPELLLVRNLHYWAAQLLIACAAVFLWRTLTTRRQAPAAPWRRASLALAAFVLVSLAVSGFLLRGDADARELFPLVAELVTHLPFIGPFAAHYLFSDTENLATLLFGHMTAAAVLLGLISVSVPLRPLPQLRQIAVVAGAVLVTSLILTPGLNGGFGPERSAPWLLAGVREFLSAVPSPLLLVAGAAAALWFWWALPRFAARSALRVQLGLLVLCLGYTLLCLLGVFWATANGRRTLHWPAQGGGWRLGGIIPAAATRVSGHVGEIPVVQGRPEGCLVCHTGVTGLGNSHRPEAIGCASCHGGDTTTLDPDRAHAPMVRIPGNLADLRRTCGTTGCHAEIAPRVERSIMTTFAGVVAVNRRVFGEPSDPAAPAPHVRQLGSSAADSHARQLCASCHLGQPKDTFGPITQESRGGGCNACHLVYSNEARQQLACYNAAAAGTTRSVPSVHPAFSVNPENGHCFGCHSRSGRISTSYDGWHELREPPTPAELAAENSAAPKYRLLEDGRYFVRVTPDVHQSRGLDCIDCHTSAEVMGSGKEVRHQADQVQIRCEDCHANPLRAQPVATLDAESHKLLALRGWSIDRETRLGSTPTGTPLVNVFVRADGAGQLRRKRTGTFAELRPPSAACRAGTGHARLSCASCHTPWAPRCASCHTRFDPQAEGYDHLAQMTTKGAWKEDSGPFEATPPTLGIRLASTDHSPKGGLVDTFVPGMILDIDRNRQAAGPRDPVFRRLYARLGAHTVSRAARSCESCHNDPVAIGYGRGILKYEVAGKAGHWRFTPAHAPSPHDGLPEDAWIGFLQTRTDMVATRDEERPFNLEEQRRILRVGACLTCHAGDSVVMRDAIADFASVLARMGARCTVPSWP